MTKPCHVLLINFLHFESLCSLAFTHKGKPLSESNINDSDHGEQEDDYEYDIANELLKSSKKTKK